MAYPMDTPSRVLRRVQQMEDVELPSLPSIEHSLDDETASEAESSLEASLRSRKGQDEHDMATPHPLRQSFKPRSSESSLANTTPTDPSSIGSPFPPNAADTASSPYVPNAPATSTPTTLQSRASRTNLTGPAQGAVPGPEMERTRSSHSLKSSTGTGREKWHTPGEMSRSFSGDEISPEGSVDGEALGDEKSIPLNDTSMGRDYSFSRPLTETPYTRRLSNGNVLHQRPGRRASSNIYRSETGKNLGALSPISASTGTNSTPHSVQTAVHLPTAGRIPSLTHSEQSETDGSEPAGTPEGPSREISVRSTPRQVRDVSQHYDDSLGEGSRSITEVVEFELPSLPSLAVNAANEMDLTSPAKPSVSEIMSTPGVGRLQSPRHTPPFAYQQTPYAPSPLSDITLSQKNTPSSIPFTPSPGSVVSKGSDFSTPRAPLNDAERRKNHVLAVLSSTEMPSRKTGIRRTPHPLRRVSNAQDSVHSNGSPALQMQSTTFRSASETVDRTQIANESFVSIASSADLTSDHRASRIRAGVARANTSFPTILLPTGKNTSGGSLKGLSETRADGVKIHRHLNAMNKQLLETNAGLAREAEAWRDEVDRLMEVLRQAGVDFEEVDVLANLSMQIDQTDVSKLDTIPERLRQRSRDTSGVYSPLAAPAQDSIMQGEMEDMPLMSELLAEQLTLVDEKRNNGDRFPAGFLLDGLSDEDHRLVMEELVDRLDLLEDHLVQKVRLVKDLRQELDVAHGFGSTEAGSTAGTQLRLDELTHKLEDADKERAAMQSSFAQRTEEHAKQFGEICTGFEEQVASLEKELSTAKSDVERLRTEKERLESLQSKGSQGEREVELRKQLGEVEVELRTAREEAQARAAEIESLKHAAMGSQQETAELVRKAELAETRLEEAQEHLDQVEQELQEAKIQLEDRQTLRTSLDDNTDTEKSQGLESINAQLEDELVQQDKDIQELSDKVAELQADLDAMLDEREDTDALRAEIDRLNQLVVEVEDELAERDGEIEALRGKANLSQSIQSATGDVDRVDDHVLQLEHELEDAFKEIGRLKHELSATPHRKSVIDMRDMRIQSLEREKTILQERLANARDASVGMKAAASPFKATPLLRKAASVKHLTPGPIMEMSWLQTTIGDSNEAAMRAQMEYLQKELDAANNQLDANFTRLEAAGLNGLNLAERLATAQDRVSELEAELRALRVKGKGAEATRSTEQAERDAVETRLKAALKSVNDQLKTVKLDYAAEQDRLQGDNARLRDFVVEVRAKSDAKFDQVLGDMERMQVESAATVKRLTGEKAKVEGELETLQRELRSSSTKLRQLERDLQDHHAAYDDHVHPAGSTDVQAKPTKIQQLERTLHDLRSNVNRLQTSLDDRVEALSAAENRIASMKRERQATANELVAFEKDLRAQQLENAQFGRELSRLKDEQVGSVSRHKVELDTLRRDLRTAREAYQRSERHLTETKRDHAELTAWKSEHDCEAGLGLALEGQKMRFKAQSRELAAQVKYLKAKFTREATFRNALAIQKRYLLLLVGGYSLNEQAILKQIASMGYPAPPPPRPRRTLKAVAIAVLGTIRARNAAGQWRRERRLKNEAVESYNDRKRDGL